MRAKGRQLEFVCCAVVGSWVLLAPGAVAALSDAGAVALIERSKVVGADAHVQARVGPGEVALSLYRNPKANDKDCKIDAILMAKALMDAEPRTVAKVKVRFYDPSNRTSYREVNVGTGVVKAFGQGRVSTDELLSSVVIDRGEQDISRYRERSYKEISQSPDVIDGIYRSERLNLLSRIQMLRQRGVGVQPYTSEFLRIEDKVRQGDQAAVIKGLEALSEKLADQEDRYNQAQAAAQARANSSASTVSAVSQAERLRQELGDLAPAIGPKLARRYRIARRILDLQSEGRIVDQFRRLYREIEELAARGDSNALKLRLTVAEHQLGLPSYDQE